MKLQTLALISCKDKGSNYFKDESLDDGSNSSNSLAEEAVRKRGSEFESNDSSRKEVRPGLVRKGPDSPILSGRTICGPEAARPSSDMVTPFVRVKLEFGGLLMNNQSPKLATRRKLGNWDVSGQGKLVAVPQCYCLQEFDCPKSQDPTYCFC